MGRVAQFLTSKLFLLTTLGVLVCAGGGIGLAIHSRNNGHVQTVANAQHQLTQISYDGQNGVTAYALLLRHAAVQAKRYSFGYFVTSINGVAGNGPKYWTYYIDGKEAATGPSSYVTKNSDRITWKLQ